MKTVRFVVAAVILTVMTGCATTTGIVAGGLIGGAIGGNKGAVIGGLAGGGVGVLSDYQNHKDAELLKKVEERGGNKNPIALRAQANSAEAAELYRQCEELRANTPSSYAKGELPNCSYILDRASANGARVEGGKLMDKVDSVGSEYGAYGSSYGGGCVGSWLRANSISPHHSKIELWRERARLACREGWPNNGNRHYGYRR